MNTATDYRMPFGKHRGCPLDELPDDYLCWLYSLDNLREPLRSRVEGEFTERRDREAAEYSTWRSTRQERWQAGERQRGATERPGSTPPPRTREVVESGFRTLAKMLHPDHGGSDEAMRELLTARQWLVRIVELCAPQKAEWQ